MNNLIKLRRQKILELVNAVGSISVVELAINFRISKVTVRHDLDALEADGKLIRQHGRAVSVNLSPDHNTLHYPYEIAFSEKQQHNRNVKTKLAKQAATYIQDGDTIYLDSGTTIYAIAEVIAHSTWTNLMVITNSLPICQRLSNIPGVKLVLLGGDFNKKLQCFCGDLTKESIQSLRFDKFFTAADGFHLDYGLTTPNKEEASLISLLITKAKEVYLIIDHTKFGRKSEYYIADCYVADVVICDYAVAKKYSKALTSHNIEVVQV